MSSTSRGAAAAAPAAVLRARYQQALAQRGFQSDPAQLAALARLEDLRARLLAAAATDGLGRWRRILRRPAPAVRGLYLWGGVGRGK
ncbi:MAG TPA: AFG1/ZapE family ATPase, partial [Candidatus Dormibacteraeota bacterium]|nr:AFG1/ZapE family ATPase [Candidatus Dormibacteraeota bacterium]